MHPFNGGKRMAFSLALSGGGCRGAAHIGVLMALEEAGLRPPRFRARARGAIVAGLFAYGYAAKDLEQIAASLTPRLVDPDLFGILRAVGQLAGGRRVTLSGLLRGRAPAPLADHTDRRNADQLGRAAAFGCGGRSGGRGNSGVL